MCGSPVYHLGGQVEGLENEGAFGGDWGYTHPAAPLQRGLGGRCLLARMAAAVPNYTGITTSFGKSVRSWTAPLGSIQITSSMRTPNPRSG